MKKGMRFDGLIIDWDADIGSASLDFELRNGSLKFDAASRLQDARVETIFKITREEVTKIDARLRLRLLETESLSSPPGDGERTVGAHRRDMAHKVSFLLDRKHRKVVKVPRITSAIQKAAKELKAERTSVEQALSEAVNRIKTYLQQNPAP